MVTLSSAGRQSLRRRAAGNLQTPPVRQVLQTSSRSLCCRRRGAAEYFHTYSRAAALRAGARWCADATRFRRGESTRFRCKQPTHARCKQPTHARCKQPTHARCKQPTHARCKQPTHARCKQPTHARCKQPTHARCKRSRGRESDALPRQPTRSRCGQPTRSRGSQRAPDAQANGCHNALKSR